MLFDFPGRANASASFRHPDSHWEGILPSARNTIQATPPTRNVRPEKLVLGLNASPRPSGNTGRLVTEVLRGAESAGCNTELHCLGELKVGPLEAGEEDDPFGVRGPPDGMLDLFESLESMDAFVFGSPIYFDHISAQGKAFIDRLICYSEGDRKGRFPEGVPAVLGITYEWDNPRAYDGVLVWLRERFQHYFKMRIVGTLAAGNTKEVPIGRRKDILKEAHRLGASL